MTTEQHHPYRIGIIVGVSVSAITTVGFWAFGKLPAILNGIAAGFSFVVGLLQTPIPVATWLLALLTLGVAIPAWQRVALILEKRRTAKAERAAVIRDALLQPINEVKEVMTQALQLNEPKSEIPGDTPKEPELDEAKIDSVAVEEYDGEEEEENWESYTTDNILDIDWRWRWHGTSIKSLTAHCPECDLELYAETSRIDATGIMSGELLHGFRCGDEECGWSVGTPTQYETLDGLHDYVKKYIRREARQL